MNIRLKNIFLFTLLVIMTIATTASGADETIILDGFNIAPSVRGIPLKDAYNDQFKIGVGLYGSSIQTDSLNSEPISEIIKYHFNSATYTNLMKPSYILDHIGSIRNLQAGNPEPAVKFDSVIKGLDFCQENGIEMRGHVLVWHAQTPDWFFREGYMTNTEYVNRETMLLRLESYIKQVLEFVQTEYPGVIYAWDVVNEAIDNVPGNYETKSGFSIRTRHGDDSRDNPWYKVLDIDYVEKSFEFARKYADPEVKLFYNDYNTFQPARREAIYNLASHLKNKGLIDGIGMQSYIGLDYPGLDSGTDNYKAALTRFGELGLELHITELSIDAGGSTDVLFEKQAARYRDVFRILTEINEKVANITSVTLFGLMDNYYLYDDDTQTNRLFDGNLQPKPAFYQVVQPYKPWYVNKAYYEGALKLENNGGQVLAKIMPGEYTIQELKDFGFDLSKVNQVWLAKGYILEILSQSGVNEGQQFYVGDDTYYSFPPLKTGDKIVIKENTSKNLVLNKPVDASHRSDRASRAIDGELVSSWSVNDQPPYWLSVDLEKSYVLTHWIVYHRGGGGVSPDFIDGPVNTANFKLQISVDNVNWHDVDIVENNVLSKTDRAITPVEARYVRLVITKPSSFDFNREAVIYELEVYGFESE